MQAHTENRTFASGAVRDGGKKPALQLISPHAMFRLGEWLRFACEDRKPHPYPVRNWERGIPMSECVASLQRHVEKFKMGDQSEDHVAAILFGGMALAHYEEEIAAGRLSPTIDDMPKYVQGPRPYLKPLLPAEHPCLETIQTYSVEPKTRVVVEGYGGWHEEANPFYVAGLDLAKPGADTGGWPVLPSANFTVYLCGPITGQEIDYVWRNRASALLGTNGIETLDPLRGKHPEDVSNMGLSYKGQLAAPEIAERDRMDIEEADAILAHFPYEPPRQSIGSWMEIGAAAIGMKKPVILCSAFSTPNEHLFCRNFCTLEPNLDSAIERIIALANVKRR